MEEIFKNHHQSSAAKARAIEASAVAMASQNETDKQLNARFFEHLASPTKPTGTPAKKKAPPAKKGPVKKTATPAKRTTRGKKTVTSASKPKEDKADAAARARVYYAGLQEKKNNA